MFLSDYEANDKLKKIILPIAQSTEEIFQIQEDVRRVWDFKNNHYP